MTTTLAHQQLLRTARDWAEIQERMLVPLYEAVYERLGVGADTRLLGLGCGSGLALLLAAARGARVVGIDTDEARLALARMRLTPEPQWGAKSWSVQLLPGGPQELPAGRTYTLVTAFDGVADPVALAAAAERSEVGAPVVLAGWGAAERCAAAAALRVAQRLTPGHQPQDGCGWRPGGRAQLEELARRAGLEPAEAGEVDCPFGYPDVESAVRGLLSTGFYGAALRSTDEQQLGKELVETLHGYTRPDGTVWLPNLFHYVVARVRPTR
ncbi:methyltransferase domain-containing protein [Streptomyces alkaliterrae]|uniref:Methyltransferase domain-containing protein n=1 Tax=Streptomyces alkaliterrae TaxID=2213162 RepID=A0A5P0YPR7_9ACTN|nr:methyltransferase domain-containing protein [Streptomyces alkaliterrae]MBB1252360.1 methyltransferase domain-containing protein [Streptomyces alkaliterrae]MBB1257256.1 methyltransferase domain-containing protein [Streptomyces alkaliterrae]MQS02271.1 methyltransferase domain-containing protein [Streptomyces alkaliterrae]